MSWSDRGGALSGVRDPVIMAIRCLALKARVMSLAMQNAKLGWYLTTIVKTRLRPTASPLVSDALDRIARAAPMSHAQPLQLLALRRYLRIQNRDNRDLASLWSWTAEQVNESANMLRSEDGALGIARQLLNEAARVQRAFASAIRAILWASHRRGISLDKSCSGTGAWTADWRPSNCSTKR
jgi:hypothetical protein